MRVSIPDQLYAYATACCVAITTVSVALGMFYGLMSPIV